MEWVSVSVRIVLAAVFALAAYGKLADHRGTRAALVDFRVPDRLVPAGAWLLPGLELLAAVLLLRAATARAGAVLAAALLAAFIVGISAALRGGEPPACHFSGALPPEPASRAPLVRNALLLVTASTAAVASPPPIVSWLGDRDAAELCALGLGAALLILIAVTIDLAARLRTTKQELE